VAVSLDVSLYDILRDLDDKRIELSALKKKIPVLNQQINEKRDELVGFTKNIERYIDTRKQYYDPKK